MFWPYTLSDPELEITLDKLYTGPFPSRYGMVVYTLHQRGKDKSLGQSKLVDQASADLLKSAVAVTIIFIITIGLSFKWNTNITKKKNSSCKTCVVESLTNLIKAPFGW